MWEVCRGRRVYYRYQKSGGRSRRIYIGSGPAAELLAAQDEERRAALRAHRAAEQSEATHWAAIQQPSLEFQEHTLLLMQAALYAAGCYQQDRHWRQRDARRT